MAVNKVVFGDRTLIDLTTDNTTASDVRIGKTFHASNGEIAIGTNTETGKAATIIETEVIENDDYLLNVQFEEPAEPINYSLISNDVTLTNITLLANGFLNISNRRPATPNGYSFLFAQIKDFGVVSTHDSITATSNGNYILGTGGATIDRVVVTYWFQKTTNTND